jgi:nitric oxide reductase subunit B
MHYKRLWICLTAVIVVSFAILGYYGREIYRQAPPVPERVVTSTGDLLWHGNTMTRRLTP